MAYLNKDKHIIGQLSLRQLKFVELYTSPASETYSNARASAIKAGYSEKTSLGQTSPLIKLANSVIAERREAAKTAVNDGDFYNDLLRHAEKGIAERVKADYGDDARMTTIQQKDQHLVVSALGKDTWSTRVEQRNTYDGNLNISIAHKLLDAYSFSELEDKDEKSQVETPTYRVVAEEEQPEKEQEEPEK